MKDERTGEMERREQQARERGEERVTRRRERAAGEGEPAYPSLKPEDAEPRDRQGNAATTGTGPNRRQPNPVNRPPGLDR